MMIYMVQNSGGGWLKSYTANGDDTYTSVWAKSATAGKVFFSWADASEAAKNSGGTVVKFIKES